MASTNANIDNIGRAVDLTIAGKMNLEKFKKVMPQSYDALWRDRHFINSEFSKSLLAQISTVAQSKLMLHHPEIMTQEIRYRFPNKPEKLGTLKQILPLMTFTVGMDKTSGWTPYMPKILTGFYKQIKRRCELFSASINNNSQGDDNDNRVLGEIYFEAYCATAYHFQEEIETHHANKMTMDQVFTYMHNRDGFVQDIMVYLEDCVTLPSQVATVQELVKEVTNFYRAQAVSFSFGKMIYVMQNMPDFYKCLQCWVCQANHTQHCSSCQVAAFCGTTCQRVAWQRNHKVMCPHFRRIREYAQVQCQKIAKVHKQGFIPGCHFPPHQFFDHLMVIISVEQEARLITAQPSRTPDQMPSMDDFYKNIAKVANDDQSFPTVFKNQSDGDDYNSDSNLNQYSNAISSCCIGLMYNGSNRPYDPVLVPTLTRDTFLKEYKNAAGYPPQSEEMVMASVRHNLFELSLQAE